MKWRLYLLAVLNLLWTGCNDREERGEEIIIDSDHVIVPHVDDIFRIRNSVKLETNTDCIIGEIRKILEHKSMYYVSDRDKICVFFDDGRHSHTINRSGRGGQEYASIADFNILNDQIILLDRTKKNLLFYDLLGNYQSSVKIDFWASSFGILDNQTIVVNADYERPVINKFRIYNILDSVWRSDFYGMSENRMSYMHFSDQSNFSYKNNRLIFNEVMNKEILELTEDSYTLIYNIKFKNHYPPESFWNSNYEDVRDFMTKFKKFNYMSGAGFFMEQNDKILFSFGGSSEANMCLYSKEVKESMLFAMLNILDGVGVPMVNCKITPQYDNSAIIAIPLVYMFDEAGNPKTQQWGEGILVDENPILYQFELK